jgi:hypothetical protein
MRQLSMVYRLNQVAGFSGQHRRRSWLTSIGRAGYLETFLNVLVP